MTETSLIRMIAGAQRELKQDLDLSPLQAIDRLQKLHLRFKEDWVSTPWIVLPDNYCIPATMPVPEMLDAITKHGDPCGIVGIALLNDGTARVLKIHFKKDDKCHKTVNRNAGAAWERYLKLSRQINVAFQKGKGDA
jgi:hypothetical protein